MKITDIEIENIELGEYNYLKDEKICMFCRCEIFTEIDVFCKNEAFLSENNVTGEFLDFFCCCSNFQCKEFLKTYKMILDHSSSKNDNIRSLGLTIFKAFCDSIGWEYDIHGLIVYKFRNRDNSNFAKIKAIINNKNDCFRKLDLNS